MSKSRLFILFVLSLIPLTATAIGISNVVKASSNSKNSYYDSELKAVSRKLSKQNDNRLKSCKDKLEEKWHTTTPKEAVTGLNIQGFIPLNYAFDKRITGYELKSIHIDEYTSSIEYRWLRENEEKHLTISFDDAEESNIVEIITRRHLSSIKNVGASLYSCNTDNPLAGNTIYMFIGDTFVTTSGDKTQHYENVIFSINTKEKMYSHIFTGEKLELAAIPLIQE